MYINSKTNEVLKKLLVPALVSVTIVSTSVSLYLVVDKNQQTVIMPDYMPVEQDVNVTILPEISEEEKTPMDIPEGGGGAIVVCDTAIIINLGTKEIDMGYQNPANSASAVVLQLMIDDVVIAQSGSIYPGYQLQDMTLLDTVKLQPGGYYGVLKAAFYNPETAEKAMVDSNFEVTITVVP